MASQGVNKVILVGNLGQPPEFKNTQTTNICNISVATSQSYKDKSGEFQSKTEWHKVVAYGRLAEIMFKYLKKGSKVYIEGSLSTTKWQDKQGIDRYTTQIVASEMQMLDGKSDKPQGEPNGNVAEPAFVDDDIPF